MNIDNDLRELDRLSARLNQQRGVVALADRALWAGMAFYRTDGTKIMSDDASRLSAGALDVASEALGEACGTLMSTGKVVKRLKRQISRARKNGFIL